MVFWKWLRSTSTSLGRREATARSSLGALGSPAKMHWLDLVAVAESCPEGGVRARLSHVSDHRRLNALRYAYGYVRSCAKLCTLVKRDFCASILHSTTTCIVNITAVLLA